MNTSTYKNVVPIMAMLVLAMAFVPIGAAATTALCIDDVKIASEETITIPIKISTADQISGITTNVAFSKNLVRCVGVGVGDSTCVRMDRINDGLVRITTSGALSGNQVVASLVIKANGNGAIGSTMIQMQDVYVYDSAYNEVDVTIDNGVITVFSFRDVIGLLNITSDCGTSIFDCVTNPTRLV